MPAGKKGFQKGNPGGPGRPKKDPAFAQVYKLTKHEVEQGLIHFLKMDVDELEETLKDKKRTVMEHMVGRVALMAIKNGDYQRLNFLLERIIGKPKEAIEHTVIKPTIVELSNGKTIELGAKTEGAE